MVPTRLGLLQVEMCGSGPPAVLWHSLFVDSTTWERVREPLSSVRRLILIDGPSHGGSPGPGRIFTLDECAGAAADVITHLGGEGPGDWVGNAWGGHVGLLLAAASPYRVRSLITIGTPVKALSSAERPKLTALVTLYRMTGPIRPLVKTVTNEVVTAEELGGASVHATRSSIADGAFENDVETLLQMRRLIDFLPANNTDGVPEWPSFDDVGRVEMSLDTLIPDNPNKPYDMKELILKVVDEGDFFEISETFAKNIVTGFGRIAGRTVGFVAHQPMVLAGVLDSDASRKAARFVRFCDAFNIPIVTFVDVPGFLPGTAQEYGGLIKHGAKLLFAYSPCTVPLVTVITRQA